MDMRIPPLKLNIMLESNPLKSTMLVGRLAVAGAFCDVLVGSQGTTTPCGVEVCHGVTLGVSRRNLSLSLSLYIYIYIHTY